MTLYKDLGIKTVRKVAVVFYKRFYVRPEIHENPPI